MSVLKLFFVWFEGDSERFKCLIDDLNVASHNIPAQLNDWAHDELVEGALQLFALTAFVCPPEFLLGCVIVVIAPESFHQNVLINLELLGVIASKSVQSESPAEVAGAEGHGAFRWVHLKRVGGGGVVG